MGKIYIESRSNPEVKIEDNVAIDDLSPDRRDGPEKNVNMSQLLLLGKFEYTGGPIFKVVLEC